MQRETYDNQRCSDHHDDLNLDQVYGQPMIMYLFEGESTLAIVVAQGHNINLQ